jgi:hypothetical protein
VSEYQQCPDWCLLYIQSDTKQFLYSCYKTNPIRNKYVRWTVLLAIVVWEKCQSALKLTVIQPIKGHFVVVNGLSFYECGKFCLSIHPHVVHARTQWAIGKARRIKGRRRQQPHFFNPFLLVNFTIKTVFFQPPKKMFSSRVTQIRNYATIGKRDAYRVVVIGAGSGGLSVAAALAKSPMFHAQKGSF